LIGQRLASSTTATATVTARDTEATPFDVPLHPGAERSRDDNFLLVRSTYRHRFGTFSGSLDGIELAEGRGVMESHTALW